MIPAGAFERSVAQFLEPIRSLLDDRTVNEIMINGPAEIWVEKRGLLERTDSRFPSAESLEAALTNISQYSGRPLDGERPILEAHLPDGSRIEAVLAPIAEGGPIAAIRRFSKSALTVERLVELGSLTGLAARFLTKAVAAHVSVAISGGTGTGKTSFLGALANTCRANERIVVIEDTREIHVEHPHVVYLEARSADERGRGRVTIRDLLRATLRLRPDRIVIGEVRGGEALDLIQAMTSGHKGSLTTVHANSAPDALRRLETMALTAESGLPLAALRAQIASAIDLVVQVERCADGRRRVESVSSVRGLDGSGDYAIAPYFARNEAGSLAPLRRSGRRSP
jgi:pilus assembly protein CpaF